MKYATQVYFALHSGDFNPHEITKILKIQPTKQGRKGEIGRYIPQLKYSFWQLSTEKGKEYLDIPILVAMNKNK